VLASPRCRVLGINVATKAGEPSTLLARMNAPKATTLCCWLSLMRIVRLALLLLLALCPSRGFAEQISLEREHGIYMVPVRINQAVSIPFVLDSGAAEVAIPADVFMTLMRSHSVMDSDFIGEGIFVTADGTKHKSQQFILREVQVGTHVIRGVVANVVPIEGDALLGQSFLSRLPSWSIDNNLHVLNLGVGEAMEASPAEPSTNTDKPAPVTASPSGVDAAPPAQQFEPRPTPPPVPADNADTRYFTIVYGMIRSHLRKPSGPGAVLASGGGAIVFTVDGSGNLIQRRLVSSCGSPSLDMAVMTAITEAEPYPAPPNWQPRSMRLTYGK
jgi:TonB family protein